MDKDYSNVLRAWVVHKTKWSRVFRARSNDSWGNHALFVILIIISRLPNDSDLILKKQSMVVVVNT